MKTKTWFSVLLLAFVAVSVALAFRKIVPESPPSQQPTVASSDADITATPIGLNAELAVTRYSAVYFHSPHRCPTCRKIESFAHEALAPEIEAGKLGWRTADYTSDSNAELVKRFEVFTSTVVLVEVEDGKVVRWKNLEEVWNHTGEQPNFTAFMHREWERFQGSSVSSKVSNQRSEGESSMKTLVSRHESPIEVLQFGTMHEAIGQQKFEGRVAIASLIEKPHFFGVGALEKLQGEVTMLDSQAIITTVDASGALKSLDGKAVETAQATMLAGGYVDQWSEESIDSSLPQKELEAKIEQIAQEKGFDLTKAFIFTVEGRLDEVTFHVINGACPLHAKIHNKPIPAENQPHHQTLTNLDAKLVGIFAKDATGKLTHPGTQIHAHVIYLDASGKKRTGHVEQVTVGSESVLKIPRTDSRS